MKATQADAVIVGSGVAGALVAAKLAAAGRKVVMLEAGGRVRRSQALRRFANAAVKTPECPYPPDAAADFPVTADADHWYRQAGPDPFKSTYLKAVGGTTWHWLGTCVRFLPNDFRLRSLYGQGVDWPIGYDELAPFYAAAETELGVAGDAAADTAAPRGPFPLPPIAPTYLDQVFARALAGTRYRVTPTPQARNSVPRDGRPACQGSATCIPICPTGAKYEAVAHVEQAERAGAEVRERATVTRLEVDDAGRVSQVSYRRPDNTEEAVAGRVVVLAAHAVETPRLLLHSRSSRLPNGVANRSGAVGRYLMDHPVQLSWALAGEPVWPYRGPISTSGIENLRDGAERAERGATRTQISNDGWNWPTGVAIGFASSDPLGGPPQSATNPAARHVQLASLVEQLPDAANRVTLDDEHKDGYGVPLPRMRFDIGGYAKDGLAAARQLHANVLAKLDATSVRHKDEFQGAGHIIGTGRMGEDPKSSVVDDELRAHDHDNLYIVGSTVFPTSGTANPTLTIAALALRLAKRLQADLANR